MIKVPPQAPVAQRLICDLREMAEAIETGVANVQFLSRIPVAGRADVEEELWDFEYGPGKWATVRRVVPSGRVGSMPTEIRWAE